MIVHNGSPSSTNGQVSFSKNIDVAICNGRDLAFISRFAQARLSKHQRPLLVCVVGPSKQWQDSILFKQAPDLLVASAGCRIISNATYFFTPATNIVPSEQHLNLQENDSDSSDFLASLLSCLENRLVVVKDLVMLRIHNSVLDEASMALLDRVEQVWTERQDAVLWQLENCTVLAREQIYGRLCNNASFSIPPKSPRPTGLSQPALAADSADAHTTDELSSIYGSLLSSLNKFTGLDFSKYRLTWLAQGIRRRCNQVDCEKITDYIRYCDHHHQELIDLKKILFPGQSNPRAFARFFELSASLIPYLVTHSIADHQDEIRIWVPGAGIAEEAYAFALAWHQFKTHSATKLRLKLFVTDIEESSLEIGGKGISRECVEAIETEFEDLECFELTDENLYRFPDVRSQMVFSPHDLLSAPPFNHLDLIICRNTLGQFKEVTRQSLIKSFCHGLATSGLLVLDEHEKIAVDDSSFCAVTHLANVYQKFENKGQPKRLESVPPISQLPKVHYAPSLQSLLRYHKRLNRYKDYNKILNQLLDHLVPAGMLVDNECNIIHVLGNVSDLLTPGLSGDFTKDIRQRLISPLNTQVAEALAIAMELRIDQQLEPMRIDSEKNFDQNIVFTQIKYIPSPEDEEPFFAILFRPCNRKEVSANPAYLREPFTGTRATDVINLSPESENAELLNQNLELNREVQELTAINEQIATRYEKLLEAYQVQSNQQLVLDSLLRESGSGFLIVDAKSWELLYASPSVAEFVGIDNLTLGENLSHTAHPILHDAIVEFSMAHPDAKADFRIAAGQASIVFRSLGRSKVILTLIGKLEKIKALSLA